MRRIANWPQWRIGDSNEFPEDAVQQATYGDGGDSQGVNGAKTGAKNGAKTGAVGAADARLVELAAAWPALSDSVKSEILKLVRDGVSVSRTS